MLSECQRVWIQIMIDVLSVLIWIQNVFKVYQQTTKVSELDTAINVSMMVTTLCVCVLG